MKIKFNKYERVAGLFVLTAIVGVFAGTVMVAIQKGWFEPKIPFSTTLNSADGIRIGTSVQIAGLKAGSIREIELRGDSEIQVTFEVSKKFHRHIREDSVVRVVRPFIIGEKVLEVTVGSGELPELAEHRALKSEASFDIMDLMNANKFGPQLAAVGKIAENLRFVAENLFSAERSRAIVEMFDELRPTVKHLGTMSKEGASLIQDLNKQKKLVRVVDNLVAMTDEIQRNLPTISREAPGLAADLTKIARNTAILTDELQKALPLMQEVTPELPRVSRRAIEALDETVVTLKALQKSIVLRASVEDVREEEAAREQRRPASETEPKPNKK